MSAVIIPSVVGEGRLAANLPNSDSQRKRLRTALRNLEKFKSLDRNIAYRASPEPQEVSDISLDLATDYLYHFTHLRANIIYSAAKLRSEQTGEDLSLAEPKRVLKECGFADLKSGLLSAFKSYGHTGKWETWVDDSGRRRQRGNPVVDNEGMASLLGKLRLQLALEERGVCRVRPLLLDTLASMGKLIIERFLEEGHVPTYDDLKDVETQAANANGVNMGLRFDEIHKSAMSGLVVIMTVGCKITIRQPTKSSVREVEYTTKAWPECAGYGIYVDAEFWFLFWLSLRGSAPGLIFCKQGSDSFDMSQPLQTEDYKKCFRSLLVRTGMSVREALEFAGHSPKRGAVHSYRGFGYKDSWIRTRIHMLGSSFWYYSENFNSERPEETVAGCDDATTLLLLQSEDAEKEMKREVAMLAMKSFAEMEVLFRDCADTPEGEE